MAKVSSCDSLSLFCSRMIGCSSGKLNRMMEIGSDRMEGEFNLVHITKQLRNLKLMLKEQSLLNEELRIITKNSGKNVIELDSEPDESSNSDLEELRLNMVNEIMSAQNSRTHLSLQPSQISID